MAGWLFAFVFFKAGFLGTLINEPELPIAVIGDTQRTSMVETMFLLREQNDEERELLMRHLVRTKFGLLVHLGDMVFDGAAAADWQEFDRLFAPVFARGIPFISAIGNHEYWGNNQQALAHFVARFPWLKNSRWNSRRHHRLGLIVIDSNIAEYAEADWAEQTTWFKSTLQEMDGDPDVRATLVFSHHPPFTNSTVIDDSPYLVKDFLPAFFSSPKTMAFISGHVHGYERFLLNGKTFIVSGGGGGPRLPLRERANARHVDQFQGPVIRPFNYLLLYPEADKLRIEVMGLDKGQSQVRLIDEVTLAYH